MYQGVPLSKVNGYGFHQRGGEAVHLTKVVPFLVEDELKASGRCSRGSKRQPFAIVDAEYNRTEPASSTVAAKDSPELLECRDAT